MNSRGPNSLAANLTMRIVVITAVYAIIAYYLFQNSTSQQEAAVGVPVMFVLYGAVILANILVPVRWHHAWNAKRDKSTECMTK